MMCTLQLDEGTFRRSSTVSGLFEDQPDQIQRLTHSSTDDLLYFTEDGDVEAGVHARDASSRFFTISQSEILPGETTGLSFSPDGRFMYVAYQDVGALFCIWRRDGKAFGGEHVDVKYHGV
jgi:6-phosphogluconolactonase (cycloisomerase 2 family)